MFLVNKNRIVRRDPYQKTNKRNAYLINLFFIDKDSGRDHSHLGF